MQAEHRFTIMENYLDTFILATNHLEIANKVIKAGMRLVIDLKHIKSINSLYNYGFYLGLINTFGLDVFLKHVHIVNASSAILTQIITDITGRLKQKENPILESYLLDIIKTDHI